MESAHTAAPAPQGVLVLNNISKAFGKKHAVHGVTFAVQPGEVFGFLGPNGAGKSTTIRMILDILRPTAGHISIFGKDSRDARAAHGRLGYLSGDMVMDGNLTGRQYLEFAAAQYAGSAPKDGAKKDVQARRTELAELLQADLNVRIGNYSRGNRQKIGLIAALQHQPDLLLLDEPTSGFDPLVQERFAELIKDFKAGGGTVFMSSHILGEVQQLCDRIAFIKDGTILQITPVNELLEQASKRLHLQVPPAQVRMLRDRLKAIPGVEMLATPHGSHQPAEATDILCLYSGSPNVLIRLLTAFDIQNITIEEQELEEVFMRYYKQQMTRTGKDGQPLEAHITFKELA